jgi:hypothetical protein
MPPKDDGAGAACCRGRDMCGFMATGRGLLAFAGRPGAERGMPHVGAAAGSGRATRRLVQRRAVDDDDVLEVGRVEDVSV